MVVEDAVDAYLDLAAQPHSTDVGTEHLLHPLLHHLLILLHHLSPHISIGIGIFLNIPVNSWPASSSSFSGHFALTVIFKST